MAPMSGMPRLLSVAYKNPHEGNYEHQGAEYSLSNRTIVHDLIVKVMVVSPEEFKRSSKASDLTCKIPFNAYNWKAEQKLDAAIQSPGLTVLAEPTRLKKKSCSNDTMQK